MRLWGSYNKPLTHQLQTIRRPSQAHTYLKRTTTTHHLLAFQVSNPVIVQIKKKKNKNNYKALFVPSKYIHVKYKIIITNIFFPIIKNKGGG